MILSEQEKNRIRGLHKNHSVIKEQPSIEWACMGGPGANGCQSGPAGSFQIGQGGVMSLHNTQADCVGGCTSGFGWECNPSGAAGCVQTAAGPYNSMSQCVQSCGSYGDDKYSCVNNSCTAVSSTDPGYNSADFYTMDECEDSMCGDRRRPVDVRGPKAFMPVDNAQARKGNTDMERIRARALSEGTNRVLREDFEISGDEPATKTDLNNAVKHIIRKVRDAVDSGSYADYVKESRVLNEGPICGDKSGEPCGKCGDGYSWTDSHVTNSCICNHSDGKVCHSTGSFTYDDNGGYAGNEHAQSLHNAGRGDSAISSLRHDGLKEGELKRLIRKLI